jgi:hypothetical protein
MNTYKITVRENSYETYLVEAHSEEEAENFLRVGDLHSMASYVADWDIISITQYMEREA